MGLRKNRSLGAKLAGLDFGRTTAEEEWALGTK